MPIRYSDFDLRAVLRQEILSDALRMSGPNQRFGGVNLLKVLLPSLHCRLEHGNRPGLKCGSDAARRPVAVQDNAAPKPESGSPAQRHFPTVEFTHGTILR